LGDWFAQGLPAIVARRAADDADPRLRLGVPLPPAEANCAWPCACRRTMCCAPRRHRHFRRCWKATFRRTGSARCRLQDIAAARVFGAFAWQHLTGLHYVHARSDIDLLWRIDTAAQADALVARLQAWETEHGRRVDGELCLVDGGAVNWREYAGRSREVLVKRLDGAALELRDALFASTGVSA
jgi:phosphoribosyl-dephospho-CoA transferase